MNIFRNCMNVQFLSTKLIGNFSSFNQCKFFVKESSKFCLLGSRNGSLALQTRRNMCVRATDLPRTRDSKGKGRFPVTWKSFFITSAIGGMFLGMLVYTRGKKRKELERERKRILGKANIGGSFDLIDQDGKPFSSKDLLGKWVLIYFGFTHCPDVCPDEMEKMIESTEMLEKDGVAIQPLFITVDPERDNPNIVKAYIEEFSPKLIGLTGNQEQVDKATRAYRVYYSAGPREVSESEYIVDHTIIIYLVDPDGEFVDYYGQTMTAQQIHSGVLLSKAKYDEMKKPSWF